MNEKEMAFLEERIPEIAEAAVVQAYWAALASGCKVLIAEEGKLVEVSPDGSRRVIRSISPPILVKMGEPLEFP